MTWVCVSTSSPMVSVAVFRDEDVVGSARREANRKAGGAAIEMLQELVNLDAVELFVADVGPGSFTGTRVGVTLVKTLAFSLGKKCAGLTAFDLIDRGSTVAIASRKGAYLVRAVGAIPAQVLDGDSLLEAAVGYGAAFDQERFPDAANVGGLFGALVPIEPELLLPEYLLEPNISTPRTPYRKEIE